MYFTKLPKSIAKIALMFFVLGIFPGAVTQPATVAAAPAPAIVPIQLQTFGALPVMVLNYTQTPINIQLYQGAQTTGYGSTYMPIAIGLSGVTYYNDSNPSIKNITDPSGTKPTLSALPAIPPASPNTQIVSAGDYMSLFTLFPSWSVPYTQKALGPNNFFTSDTLKNTGALPDPATLVPYEVSNKNSGRPAMGILDSSVPSTLSMFLTPLDATTGKSLANYSINIKNLGAGTSSYQPMPIPSTGPGWWDFIMPIAVDIQSICTLDPLGIGAMVIGMPATIETIKSMNNPADNPDGYQQNTANPVKSAGLNVTASGRTFSINAPFSFTQGNTDSSVYQILADPSDATSYANLPLSQQNAVVIATYRQTPNLNGSDQARNSADLLIVAVINEAVYSANQAQQCMNNSMLQGAAKPIYKPTKEQAADTLKLLAIISAIAEKNPQDAQKIVKMFGTHGQYQKLKNNPSAVKALTSQLKAIFEKYQKDLPGIQQYLTKLAQK